MKHRRNITRFSVPHAHNPQSEPHSYLQNSGIERSAAKNEKSNSVLPRFKFLQDPPFFTEYPLDQAAASRWENKC